MRIGKRQQRACLVEGLPGLNGHACIEPRARHLRPRMLGQEVALQRRHRAVDPGVAGGVVDPEMLMSVDAHGP
jgi:hypothetical protein